MALVDDPDHQRQMPFTLDARGGRHLVLLGPSGSGKTTALRAIHQLAARAGVQTVRIPTDAEGSWDELQRIAERRDDRPAVILLDDLDERAAAFGEEHRQAWLDRLRDLAKLGTARSQTFVATASRGGGEAGTFLALAAHTVRLGSPSRTEFILSGGEAADHRPDLPPGRGVAGGLQLQFPSDADHIRDPSPPRHEPLDLADLADRAAAFVTRRPHRWIEPLGRLGIRIAPVPKPGSFPSSDDASSAARAPSITMGDPDEWRQSFGSIARHAARAPVVFDDLPVALTRGLLPGEPTVPPVSEPGSTVLVRESTGRYRRRAWAGAER